MDPFIGQIIQFGGSFAPRGWALCDGALLSISQHQALFSILGTTYGGDGRSTFALPDLRGRVAVHAGSGPGLNTVRLGEQGGAETVQLTTNQLPAHNHLVSCTTKIAGQNSPAGHIPGAENFEADSLWSSDPADAQMHADMIGTTGEGQAVENRQPFTSINFIIALEGTFPSRN